MTKQLFVQAIFKYLAGVLLVGLLIFLPAGTMDYWNGWLLMGILFLSMPLVLGSVFSFIIFLVYPFIISKRIKNEERVLEEGLKGYTEYKKRVEYKVIPFIW